MIGIHYSEVKLQLQKSFASVTDSFLVLQEVFFGDIYLYLSNACWVSLQVDSFACGGIDQLTDKVPQLKEAPPKIMEETKVM